MADHAKILAAAVGDIHGEARPGQQAMAESVAEAFDDGGSPPSPSEAADPTALADRFPHIMAITRDSMARTDGAGCDSDREFAFALDLLLDAFERLHAAGWQSRAPEGTTG